MLKHLKRLFVLSIIGILVFFLTHTPVRAEKNTWADNGVFAVARQAIDIFGAPDIHSEPEFKIYRNMSFSPAETIIQNGYKWFKLGNKNYWAPAVEPNGIVNFVAEPKSENRRILDLYGIMNQPHRYAVKMVKLRYMEWI